MKKRKKFVFETRKKKEQREEKAIANYIKKTIGLEAYYAR